MVLSSFFHCLSYSDSESFKTFWVQPQGKKESEGKDTVLTLYKGVGNPCIQLCFSKQALVGSLENKNGAP